jgi:ABC transporter transmembrane region
VDAFVHPRLISASTRIPPRHTNSVIRRPDNEQKLTTSVVLLQHPVGGGGAVRGEVLPTRDDEEPQHDRPRHRSRHIPQTPTIAQSFASFVKYCVQMQRSAAAAVVLPSPAAILRRRRSRRRQEHAAADRQVTSSSSSAHQPPPPANDGVDDISFSSSSSSSSPPSLSIISTIRQWNQQRKALVDLANYRRHIVLPSFAALIIGALLVSVIPHYEARCIQLVATLHPQRADLLRAIGGLLLTSTLAALFTGLRGSLFWMAGSRANYHVRVRLHENLLYQEAAFFDTTETGTLLSRLNSDVNKIGQVISYHVNVVCRQLAQFLFGSIYLIRISPRLSLFAGLGIALVGLTSAVYGKFNRECAGVVQDTFAKATTVAETSFRLSETIRFLDGRRAQSAAYERAQRRALQLEEIQAWGYGTHKLVSDALQAILHGALLFMCWSYGRTTGLPADQLTTFLFYTHFVLESSNEVGDQWAKIQGAVGASQSVFALLRRTPALQDDDERMEEEKAGTGGAGVESSTTTLTTTMTATTTTTQSNDVFMATRANGMVKTTSDDDVAVTATAATATTTPSKPLATESDRRRKHYSARQQWRCCFYCCGGSCQWRHIQGGSTASRCSPDRLYHSPSQRRCCCCGQWRPSSRNNGNRRRPDPDQRDVAVRRHGPSRVARH